MNQALLVVDVQPAYHDYSSVIARDVAKRINNTRKPCIVMWVGDGITDDSQLDVFDYLHSHGARPGKLSQCRFVEKDYGFYRTWMDDGIDREVIVKAARQMERRTLHSSHELNWDLKYLCDAVPMALQEDLRRPTFDDTDFQLFDGFETCGGGRDECLAEIEIWLDVVNKSYRRLEQLVY